MVVPSSKRDSSTDMASLKDSSIKRGTATITSPNGDITICIRTCPLPTTVTAFLNKHTESLKRFVLDRRIKVEEDEGLPSQSAFMQKQLSLSQFKKSIEELFAAEGSEWKHVVDK